MPRAIFKRRVVLLILSVDGLQKSEDTLGVDIRRRIKAQYISRLSSCRRGGARKWRAACTSSPLVTWATLSDMLKTG